MFANLSSAGVKVAATVTALYLGGSVLAALLPRLVHKARLTTLLFVAVDAALVVYLIYLHILAPPTSGRHELTASSLVVAFLLLNQVAIRLNARMILLFGGVVGASWAAMIALMTYRHRLVEPNSAEMLPAQDLLLLVSFCLTVGAAFLSAAAYQRARRQVQRVEELRSNLSRFFSPTVVADLQEATSVLDLERREAVVMFIDLRDFTAYAEDASAGEIAKVLAEYRHMVAGIVFSHGGTVDKFIGDGIMVVFGQPKPRTDDAERALACALQLAEALEQWGVEARSHGKASFHAGIGVHIGVVIGGVLESGFHDEFTVVGDVVNVAQRLEAVAKTLGSPLVVSEDLLSRLPHERDETRWVRRKAVGLAGRRRSIDIAYVRRGGQCSSVEGADYDTGPVHSDSTRSSFQSCVA
ncbi:adenylate/guanylate cyclase domain-containing protein [Rhizobium sp. YTU87027]|uniref:adenylate/guanylate cyclase domain-containing protein n=1 Tax=Rhizobium sp. YTU87027 TaxID=3417741 RepID=UPI003D68620B